MSCPCRNIFPAEGRMSRHLAQLYRSKAGSTLVPGTGAVCICEVDKLLPHLTGSVCDSGTGLCSGRRPRPLHSLQHWEWRAAGGRAKDPCQEGGTILPGTAFPVGVSSLRPITERMGCMAWAAHFSFSPSGGGKSTSRSGGASACCPVPVPVCRWPCSSGTLTWREGPGLLFL